MDKILNKIKKQAISLKLPIILDDMKELLENLISEKKPKNILEIGSANGYSAAVMLLKAEETCALTTVEKDEERFNLAKTNLAPLGKRANCLLGDAKDYLASFESEKTKFDFIFLDGPKGQYKNYLPNITAILKSGGILVCDNVHFHGMVTGEVATPKSKKTMIKNLQSFISDISASKNFNVEILNIADGVLIATKK